MSLEERFDHVLRHYCKLSKPIRGVRPGIIISMIDDNPDGAAGDARNLTHKGSNPGSGFLEMLEAGRLELTVEGAMLRPEFSELFDSDEKRTARERLGDTIADAIVRGELPDPDHDPYVAEIAE